MTQKNTKKIAYASILTAFGILIPMIMPVKIIIGPASFTLASHVPLFLATFISVPVAIFVGFGTTLGFFMAGFPIVIVMRALSQIIFAFIASIILKKSPQWIEQPLKTFIFGLLINLIHGLGELIAVYLMTSPAGGDPKYLLSLVLLVGVGTVIHGLVDFYLALFLWKSLLKANLLK
ncbi:hypothetical protein DIX60_03000 [Streptococcus iniae]|uniref:Membrane protein n=2 Tax=Streptococcus iniae TaxID=1346 RepID=A0A1J0MY59_STRIN|nr:hypothetical protein [Streptococcus iniae]AGM98379.1 membrane protein [Streptococcus iniae SF1]AHY15427.1 membrane protein [Streptococcus iniae]AHY17296.1 membrane protein [Streptococcus iniae]AJG25599.1 membrane protein [Streptococcus iniae]APD31469.1 hypothetical protein BMF34_03010 [Streptococcus iniae]